MSTEEATATTVPPPASRCPVCLEAPVLWPRFYECGHTLCTGCHRRWDERIAGQSTTYAMSVFSCPVCRAPTLLPWHRRPVNHHMRSLLPADASTGEDPAKQYRRDRNPNGDEVADDDDAADRARTTDLAERAFAAYSDAAITQYTRLLPRLLEAADRGQMRVELDHPDIVRDFQHCYRGVAQLLFENNNVYSFSCTPQEITVLLSPDGNRRTRTATNRNYSPPSVVGAAMAAAGGGSDANTTTTPPRGTTLLRDRIASLRARIDQATSSSSLSFPPPLPNGVRSRRSTLVAPRLLRPIDILPPPPPPITAARELAAALDDTTAAASHQETTTTDVSP